MNSGDFVFPFRNVVKAVSKTKALFVPLQRNKS